MGVDQIRQNLAQREKELMQREDAVRCAEARNHATAQQLIEFKMWLDEYSEKLDDDVAAFNAQQNTFQEERRQTTILQAHARRMWAAAIREEVIADNLRM